MERKDASRDRATANAVRDLEVKRRTYTTELEARRARILRRGESERLYPVLLSWDAENLACAESRAAEEKAARVPAAAPEPDNYDPSEVDRKLVRDRYGLLDELRGVSTNKRTHTCGRMRIAEDVQLETRGAKVKTIGVARCGAIHDCPVCAAILYAVRGREIDSCVEQWIGFGEQRKGPATAWAGMLTLTVKHGIGCDLEEVRSAMSAAWRRMRQGRSGQAMVRDLRESHYVRAPEITLGPNGWHPHFHVVMLCDKQPTAGAIAVLVERWADAIEAELGHNARPLVDKRWDRITHSYGPAICEDGHFDAVGVELHELTQSRDGRYLAKMGLEVCGGYETKQAGGGNRTYWQLAKDAASRDPESVRLWQQATVALKGTRQLTWSRGTRAFFGLDDLDDEATVLREEWGELPLEDAPAVDAPQLALVIPGAVWDAKCRQNRFFLSALMRAVATAAASGDWGPLIPLVGQQHAPALLALTEQESTRRAHLSCHAVGVEAALDGVSHPVEPLAFGQ
jgi:hypothetical protein